VEGEGRAPRPKGGDPNEKELAVLLSADDWRKLRLWAAEEALSVEEVVSRLLRRALEGRPRISL
jgi:hypothetical protein